VAKAKANKKGPSKPAPKPTAAITIRRVPIYWLTALLSNSDHFRNMFLTDFHREHGDNATAEGFAKAWKEISKEKSQVIIREWFHFQLR
jgi:hypothetical protein